MLAAIVRRFGLVVAALGIVATTLIVPATPAMAGSPIVYNQRGRYVPFWGVPANATVIDWARNGTHFQMDCWIDNQYYYGNYGSRRWFFGVNYATGAWEYVHSSYVYYQVSVPRCH